MSRMSLANIVKGRIDAPWRILVSGTEGIGKSTFASESPSPIFIDADDGTAQLDVARFPLPHNWGEVKEAVVMLLKDEHDYRTIVFDTLDWLERLCWKQACEDLKVSTIEEPGFGKGYTYALDLWRSFIKDIERLRAEKRMNVMFVAHTNVKTFKNPEGPDFDRYELKLHHKAAGLLKEWCDAVLHCKHETFSVQSKEDKRHRGVQSDKRIICTERTAAYDAKNRFGLPPELPLNWNEFDRAMQAKSPVNPADAIAEIEELIKKADDKLQQEAVAYIKESKGDSVKLSKVLNWVRGKVKVEEDDS